MRSVKWTQLFAAVGLLGLAAEVRADEEKLALDKVPAAVLDAVKAKFPGAELKGAEKEEEDGKTVYEINFEQGGSKYEVSLKPDGKIVEVEKQVAYGDLPNSVKQALETKYPNASPKEAEEITKDGKTSYEVVIVTAGKKKLEVKLDRTGKVLETEEGDED